MVTEFFKKFNFNGGVFARGFAKRQVSPYIGAFLDKFGDEIVKNCIKRKIWITDCLPAEYKVELKQLCQSYTELLPVFSNEEVYSWIPDRNRFLIESVEGGKDWALGQLQIIREFLSS